VAVNVKSINKNMITVTSDDIWR